MAHVLYAMYNTLEITCWPSVNVEQTLMLLTCQWKMRTGGQYHLISMQLQLLWPNINQVLQFQGLSRGITWPKFCMYDTMEITWWPYSKSWQNWISFTKQWEIGIRIRHSFISMQWQILRPTVNQGLQVLSHSPWITWHKFCMYGTLEITW